MKSIARRRITTRYTRIREALGLILQNRSAVLASEVAELIGGVEGPDVVAVARAEGLAVRRIARSYIVGRSEEDVDRFIAKLRDRVLERLAKLTSGCKTRMCCVRLAKLSESNPVLSALYIELLRGVDGVKIIRYHPDRGYRICLFRKK
ncbi:MAG: hypothetical protein QXE68_07455 [Sulfolobales archaeon]